MAAKPTRKQITEFLKESNAIESVYDEQSLTDSLEAWDYLMTQDVLAHAVVEETHRILMKNQPLEPHYKGKYRTCDVWIAGHRAIHPAVIPCAMYAWFMRILNAIEDKVLDPQALHVEYERIHPFADGNGRTGRMFYNWTRIKKCGLPIHIIKEKDKHDYYKWFQKS